MGWTPELAMLAAFIPAALALNLTPGADMLFCMGQGLRLGPAAAIAASGGVALGLMVHVLVAGLGVGALVAANPGAMEVIRWLGAAYLLVLAWQALRAAAAPGEPAPTPATANAGEGPQASLGLRRAFWQGMAVNLTNPKVILFVLAFVPQFIAPQRAVLPQFLVLGAVVALGGFLVNAAAGWGAGGLARRAAQGGARRLLGVISASIYGALALRLVLMERA